MTEPAQDPRRRERDADRRRAARRGARARVAGSDALVVVIAPVNAPREGYVVYENTRRAAAGRRLDQTLAQLREAGIHGHRGTSIDNDPLTAVRDAIAMEEPDELIVSTHPEAKSGWRRRNLLDEIRKAAGGCRSSTSSRRSPTAHRCAEHPRASRTRPCSARRCSTGSARRHGPATQGDELPDRLAAERSRPGRAPGGRAPAAAGARAAPLGGDRGARADRAPGSVHRGDARRPRRAHRRDPRLHVPRAARLLLAAPRPGRPAAQRSEGPGRARRRRARRR